MPARPFRTVRQASEQVAIANSHARLLATALADAVQEAQRGGPQACERILAILVPARRRHLDRMNARRTP